MYKLFTRAFFIVRLLGSIQLVLPRARHSRVRLPCLLAYGTLILGLVLPVTQSVQSAPTATSSSVWFVDHKTLKRVDANSLATALSVELPKKAEHLVVDPTEESIWALTGKELFKYNSTFSLLATFNLKDLVAQAPLAANNDHFEEADAVVLNPYDGSLWIAGKKILVHLDPNGVVLQTVPTADKIEAIALGLNERLWVATKKSLLQLSADGTVLGQIDFPKGGAPSRGCCRR